MLSGGDNIIRIRVKPVHKVLIAGSQLGGQLTVSAPQVHDETAFDSGEPNQLGSALRPERSG
jgi:hypothetical protein